MLSPHNKNRDSKSIKVWLVSASVKIYNTAENTTKHHFLPESDVEKTCKKQIELKHDFLLLLMARQTFANV